MNRTQLDTLSPSIWNIVSYDDVVNQISHRSSAYSRRAGSFHGSRPDSLRRSAVNSCNLVSWAASTAVSTAFLARFKVCLSSDNLNLQTDFVTYLSFGNYLFHIRCCLHTPMTLVSGGGGSLIFPLVVHQPASPSIWPAVHMWVQLKRRCVLCI